jgi:poly(A) polymerase
MDGSERDLFFAATALAARAGDLYREDPSWLLRTARLSAEEGRPPVAPVTVAARGQAAAARAIAPARARAEIEGLLMAPSPDVGLQWLHDAGLLAVILPELEAAVGFAQEAGRRHKDVWAHTKQVVKQAALRPAVRWAALVHDIGKVPTRTFTAGGKVHFHRHAEVGARMFDDVGRRFAMDRPFFRKVRFLVLHHLRASQYDAGWTDSAVRRFHREMEEHLEDLVALSRADITSRRAERHRQVRENLDGLCARMKALRAEDERLPPLPGGIGDAIMAKLGLPPGPRVGQLKRLLEQAVERGDLEPRREADYYLDWLQGQADKAGA